MSFRAQLRPASFRGVAFLTEDLSAEFGRQGVQQEPVASDDTFFDDLRRKSRVYRISAFIFPDQADSSDYISKRDALIAACETEGPGQLIHPTFGSLIVQCTLCSLSEGIDNGRSANFNLEFLQTGERSFPKAELDRPALAKQRGANALDEVGAFFEDVWDAVGQLDYVVDRGIDEITVYTDRLSEIVDETSDKLEDVATTLDRIDRFVADLASLATSPADLVEDVVEIFEGINFRDTLRVFASEIEPVAVVSDNVNDQQAESNARAAGILFRVGALAVAVQAASDEEFTSFDDTVRARDELTEEITRDEERDDVTGDFFESLIDLRVGTFQDLTERALELPKIVTYTPPGLTSALELAQLLYQDGSRADEIITRNNLPHPGFIPPVPLQVLVE